MYVCMCVCVCVCVCVCECVCVCMCVCMSGDNDECPDRAAPGEAFLSWQVALPHLAVGMLPGMVVPRHRSALQGGGPYSPATYRSGVPQ